MASIVLDSVSVTRDDHSLLDAVSFGVAQGECLAVVGPSGSGKSTLLRAVAGLDSVTSGDILFDGQVVTEVKSFERDVAMVFQDSVLMPFRSVRRNVSFPLEVRDVNRDEIDDRVDAESRAMTIDGLLERMPATLAAGHQQLVQAARAVVRRPSVLLLDEPIARVDAQLRIEIRRELQSLQRGYGVTTMWATNDPREAFAVGDRIAVLDRGRVRQIATAKELYRSPVDVFVAEFVAANEISILPGRVRGRSVEVEGGELVLRPEVPEQDVRVGVLAHHWELVDTAGLPATVTSSAFLGDHHMVEASLGSATIALRCDTDPPDPGASVQVYTDRYFLFARNGRRIATVE